MVSRYKPWAPLIILLSVKLGCLVFQIIVLKQISVCPVSINTFFNSYGMDSIFCTGFVIVTGYKSLLLADHSITDILVCRCGGGGGGGEHRREYEDIGDWEGWDG